MEKKENKSLPSATEQPMTDENKCIDGREHHFVLTADYQKTAKFICTNCHKEYTSLSQQPKAQEIPKGMEELSDEEIKNACESKEEYHFQNITINYPNGVTPKFAAMCCGNSFEDGVEFALKKAQAVISRLTADRNLEKKWRKDSDDLATEKQALIDEMEKERERQIDKICELQDKVRSLTNKL